MGAVPFARITLIDAHGQLAGDVVIAPERILLQRAAGGEIHDVTYLAVWTGERRQAVVRELQALSEKGPATIDAKTPEIQTVLQRLAPAATGLLASAGHLPRRQLKVALTRSDVRSTI
jgi:hypothetical protein